MALISPGTDITIIDESQYVAGNVGSVPFVLLATAANKTYNGSLATYTTQQYAGQLLSVTSQRDLVTNFGTPTFYTSSIGTPLNGDETNEYGLMAAYSALGVTNQMYVMRANIDLAELQGTSVRPVGNPANGAYWLDTSKSTYGVFEWNSSTQSFTNKEPSLITDPTQTTNYNGIPYPLSSYGSIGTYAVTTFDTHNYVFFKGSDNNWTLVGSTQWQQEWPAAQGTNSTVSLVANSTATLNGISVTFNGTSTSAMASDINAANISGISAAVDATTGRLDLFVTNLAMNGNTAGQLSVTDGVGSPMAAAGILPTVNGLVTGTSGSSVISLSSVSGITSGMSVTASSWNAITSGTTVLSVNSSLNQVTLSNPLSSSVSGLSVTFEQTSATFNAPDLQYGTYVNVPQWSSVSSMPRPSGSVWAKTSVLGSGASFVINKYNSSTNAWSSQTSPIYVGEAAALAGLDAAGGGVNIQAGSLYVLADSLNNNSLSYQPFVRSVQGATSVTGSVVNSQISAGSITLKTTAVGSSVVNSYTITVPSTASISASISAFVSAILAANIPNVTASASAAGAITITNTAGGTIWLSESVGTTILAQAGFSMTTMGVRVDPSTGALILSNFSPLSYLYSSTQPYSEPVNGALWYYNNPLDVDIMINDVGGWKGYRTVSKDARGYDLVNTDVNGPILSPTQPTTQSTGAPLVSGDLWVNTGNLVNFPVISRYDAPSATWTLINNTDYVDQNGIVFADARWDTSGTTDVATAAMPSISTMLLSNYVDLDAPNYQLYPRGCLLFNLRRSGYNVKRYVSNYFNSSAFPNQTLPEQTSTWVTASGLQENGAPYMGSAAQRNMVVEALRSAISSNTQILESIYFFNLIACPGYPELIADMVAMNNNRGSTGFIIGDTPMTLAPNAMNIIAWSTNANGNGLATADPNYGVYYPSGLSNDLAGNTIVVPPSHMILRTALRSDNASYPWFAFAGVRRGTIDNATDIGYIDANSGDFIHNAMSQGMRDVVYPLFINPITSLPNVGIVNFGNLTRSGTTSALNRVNVARLVEYIRVVLSSLSTAFLFEQNDPITRREFKSIIDGALSDLVSKRGLYAFSTVCDTTNNTPTVIDANEMYCDVAIQPAKDVEFIYIPVVIQNTGTSTGTST